MILLIFSSSNVFKVISKILVLITLKRSHLSLRVDAIAGKNREEDSL
ncbi:MULTISPECIES: hypothetical protein [Calothrix]|uniref:Uncharacterized protein n=2 Tax=Calothrix TaxID=1186 RepID=A0ABR8A7I3_9CYAN|nr:MULTISPECIES: hypothetical protein [Calothrix]MBD2195951.1 hypothetical protein [Calothrix parietina FACHB-288]MBD2224559.1 hypothetical protein [Calothrix anomala FACHB-343]